MIPADAAPVPKILYGTAWKEERTAQLVADALDCGFRAFDTANQRKHYFEAGVGEALAAAVASGKVPRSQLFLQTKFTYQGGQDHRLPYDPKAPLAVQVEQSFLSSLEHLRADYLDSYVLHGPATGYRLIPEDWQVWRCMEGLVKAGRVRMLGVSNVNPLQLTELLSGAEIRPQFVQNRCYPSIGWDPVCRDICRKEGPIYQGFSLIRDPRVMENPAVVAIARNRGMTVAQVVYRWALQSGMQVLAGTTNRQHMIEALASLEMQLTADDLAIVEGTGGRSRH